jgi:hypothetical protein
MSRLAARRARPRPRTPPQYISLPLPLTRTRTCRVRCTCLDDECRLIPCFRAKRDRGEQHPRRDFCLAQVSSTEHEDGTTFIRCFLARLCALFSEISPFSQGMAALPCASQMHVENLQNVMQKRVHYIPVPRSCFCRRLRSSSTRVRPRDLNTPTALPTPCSRAPKTASSHSYRLHGSPFSRLTEGGERPSTPRTAQATWRMSQSGDESAYRGCMHAKKSRARSGACE